MAQQYGRMEESNRRSAGVTESESFGTGTQGDTGHYGETTPQSSQGGGRPVASGQQFHGAGRQQQTSHQGMQSTMQTGGPTGHVDPDMTLEDALSDEMRVALHDFVQSATACEWCADRCIDEGPAMAECIRLCRDVADLATLNVQLISRDSIFGPEAAEVFADAAEACAEECAQHHHRHCQKCAEVLSRAARSTRKMLASFGGSQRGTHTSRPRL